MSQAEFLRLVVGALEEIGIPYMIVGSIASALHGMPRATQDVDVVVELEPASLARLIERFSGERFYVDSETADTALRDRTQFNVVDVGTGWKVDFVVRKARPFSAEELGRRRRARLHDVDVFVASAEDTILSKLEWSSIGGSDRQLRDAAGVIAVQRDRLDRAYLDRWSAELGLSALLERAFDLSR